MSEMLSPGNADLIGFGKFIGGKPESLAQAIQIFFGDFVDSEGSGLHDNAVLGFDVGKFGVNVYVVGIRFFHR